MLTKSRRQSRAEPLCSPRNACMLPTQLDYGRADYIAARLCSTCRMIVYDIINDYEHYMYILRSNRGASNRDDLLASYQELARQNKAYSQEIHFLKRRAANISASDTHSRDEMRDVTLEWRRLNRQREKIQQAAEQRVEQFKRKNLAYESEMTEIKQENKYMAKTLDDYRVLAYEWAYREKSYKTAYIAAENYIKQLESAVKLVHEELYNKDQKERAKLTGSDDSAALAVRCELLSLYRELGDEQLKYSALKVQLQDTQSYNATLYQSCAAFRAYIALLRDQLLSNVYPSPEYQKCREASELKEHASLEYGHYQSTDDAADFIFSFSAEKDERSAVLFEFIKCNELYDSRIDFQLIEAIPRHFLSKALKQIRASLFRKHVLYTLGVPEVAIDAVYQGNKSALYATLAFLSRNDETSTFVTFANFYPFGRQESWHELVKAFLNGYELVYRDKKLCFQKGSEIKTM